MAENDSRESEELVVVATAGSEPEADVISQRLQVAGITALAQRTIGGPEWGPSGSRFIYVRASDEARAREVLAGDAPSSEFDG